MVAILEAFSKRSAHVPVEGIDRYDAFRLLLGRPVLLAVTSLAPSRLRKNWVLKLVSASVRPLTSPLVADRPLFASYLKV